jgi:hypothetical protein
MIIKVDWVTKHCEPNIYYTIEISPLELLEQIPHTQIGELLDLINLPQVELTKETKEKIFNAIKRHRDMKLQGVLIDVIASEIFSILSQQPTKEEPKAQYCCCYGDGKINMLCPIHNKPEPKEIAEVLK